MAPSLHRKYVAFMVDRCFGPCSQQMVDIVIEEANAEKGGVKDRVNMESRFSQVGIGTLCARPTSSSAFHMYAFRIYSPWGLDTRTCVIPDSECKRNPAQLAVLIGGAEHHRHLSLQL